MRHENGEATVIPVIVRPCNFKVDPIVSSLQVLPKNARPVTSWNDRDDAWMNVVDGINRVLEKMASPDLDALRNAEELEQQQKEKGIAAKRAKPERKIRKEEELGRDAINQKDDYAWEVTLKKGTKAGYQKYLKKYPTGLHADEAKVHMKELNSTVSGKDSTLDMWVTAKSISDIHSESNNTILWVDDRPSNNIYEREALELVGFKFELALSTKEALTLLEKNKYLAIISDMGRVEGPREGYILLKEVRKTDKKIPFFIYAGSNLLEHKIEAQEKGAQGSTNSATELIDLITTHVQPKIG
jgi:CheY-like chemotaxis protein